MKYNACNDEVLKRKPLASLAVNLMLKRQPVFQKYKDELYVAALLGVARCLASLTGVISDSAVVQCCMWEMKDWLRYENPERFWLPEYQMDDVVDSDGELASFVEFNAVDRRDDILLLTLRLDWEALKRHIPTSERVAVDGLLNGMTMREIGKSLGISESGVCVAFRRFAERMAIRNDNPETKKDIRQSIHHKSNTNQAKWRRNGMKRKQLKISTEGV